ncbi:MAG: NUDIX domain-containing protein [bacterium]|nr:NUDIX domain-containing protein [bacterium]
MRFYHLLKNAILSLLNKSTLGVRVLLIHDNKVLLIKHTYQSGWYTIGGGVDPGETPREALARELKEEVGVTLSQPVKLFSVYFSRLDRRDDYIIFYIAHDFTQELVTSIEIAEQRWFSLNELPQDISAATQRRIDEYLGKIKISELWAG